MDMVGQAFAGVVPRQADPCSWWVLYATIFIDPSSNSAVSVLPLPGLLPLRGIELF